MVAFVPWMWWWAALSAATSKSGRACTEGQAVVASGQFLLDSEASLKAALSRLDTGSAAQTPLGSPPPHQAEVDRDRPSHSLVGRQSIAGAARCLRARCVGLVGLVARAVGRAARPVRRAGDRPHAVSGTGAADRRGPGHLSADDDHAVGAGREDRPRLSRSSVTRSSTCCSTTDGPVLGALPRARIPQSGADAPAGAAQSRARPDATGVGWIYEYALVDRTGKQDIGQLRALQDWFLKYELKTIPDVAEVASIGGMVRQYQVVVDPDRLRRLQHPAHRGSSSALQVQPGGRRLGRRAGRGGVHGPCARLPEVARRLPQRFRLAIERRRRSSCWATSQGSSSGRKCAAASPS